MGVGEQGGVPSSLDHYRVIRKIGRGGQGDVYLANDPHLDIEVAIKVLHAEYRDQEFVSRLMLEARIMVRLAALNIVRVYNLNPKYPYLVMEYCGDGDLNGLIKCRRPLPLTRVVSLVRQICDALVIAHEQDPPILHRDLKPGNVLFQKGVPKVADFGLAKVLSGASSGLTMSRGMMGTVGYSSPEQLKDASKVDHRTDLWAVGVILYELLTFRGPFEKPGDDDFVNTAIRVRTEPPNDPPYDVPAPLWNVVLRALQKDPAARFESAREMSSALKQAVETIPGADDILLPPESVLGEVDRMATRVADSLSSGSVEDAQEYLRKMREIAPEDSLVRYWDRKLREADTEPGEAESSATVTEMMDSRLGSVRALVARREYAEARRECGKLLIDNPDDPSIHDLLQKINEDERALSRTMDEARKESDAARASDNIVEVVEIWRRMDDSYPDHPDIRAELAVAESELKSQRRRELWKQKEGEIRTLADSGKLQAAVTLLDEYLSLHPEDSHAASMRSSIHTELATRTQQERLATLRTEARDLKRAAELERSLALWKLILDEQPTDAEAHREAESLRIEIADRKRQQQFEETRARAAACIASEDLIGALGIWRELFTEYPGDTEVGQQVAQLEKRIAENQKAAALEELKQQASRLETRLEGSRYSSLPEVDSSMRKTIKAARAALTGDLERLRAARASLVQAGRQAETRLDEALGTQRAELRSAVDRAGDLLTHEARELGGAAAAVDRALEEAMAALCEVRTAGSAGDPVAILVEAGDALSAAIDGLTRDRHAAVDEARRCAANRLEQAEQAVAALEPVSSAAGPEAQVAVRLADELALVRQKAGSSAAAALAEAELAATGIRQQATATGAAFSWRVAAELRGQVDEALGFLGAGAGERLRTLVQNAVSTLDAEPGPETTAALVPLSRKLGAEVEAARKRRDSTAKRARARWADSVRAVESLSQEELREELKDTIASAREAGERALAASRLDEVERSAALLTSLASRADLEKAWSDQARAIEALEGPPDPGGVAVGPKNPKDQQLLGRLREAVARGAAQELAGMSGELRSRAGRGARAEESEQSLEVPEIDSRTRSLNARLHPAALQRFEQELEQHSRARSGKDRATLAARAAAVRRSHEALLEPKPVWPRLIPVAAVVVVGLLAAFLVPGFLPGAAPSGVILVSPSGEVEVAGVTWNGRDVTGRIDAARTVTAEGVRWELEPGSYVVRTEHGAEVRFESPRDEAVFVPGPGPDYTRELIEQLDLQQLMGSGGQ